MRKRDLLFFCAALGCSPRICADSRSLRRLMRGERKEAVLFDGCMQFRNFLLTEKLLPKECRDAEIAMAVKVLHELGYGGESRESKTVSSESFSRELISFVAAHRHTLVSFTNARLNESHL